MTWTEFSQHPDILNSDYSNPPTGRDLLGKILHDVLECLNTYKACAEVVSVMPNVPGNVQQWFLEQTGLVKDCLSRLAPLAEYVGGKKDPGTTSWPGLIYQVGITLTETQVVKKAVDITISVGPEKLGQVVQIAVRAFTRLDIIYQDIYNKEYVRLWKIDYSK